MVLTLAQLTKFLPSAKNFDKVVNKVNIVALGNGKCTAELKIDEEHTNAMGGLHGGLSATLVDAISSYAILSHESGGPNASVNINTEYISGAKIGDEIEIQADTVKVGKSLAFLKVFIKDKKTGTLLVKGSHTTFMLRPKE